MRILVHDYSGHPFQAELSRELAARGHDVVHSSCAAYVSGKGDLDTHEDDNPRFATIGHGQVKKESLVRRSFQEIGYGLQLVRQIRSERPDVVMVANAPIPMLVVATLFMWVRRIPWVLWHQDVQAIALQNFVGDKISRVWLLAAKLVAVGEKWCARRARHIVVIAESFVPVHRDWGTAAKVTVIPNWAPLDEIVPTPRDNAWGREHGLCGARTLVYSGTLGLKHNPALLAQLTARVRELGVDARLVVVNTGPAVHLVEEESARLGVPLTLLPFQPYGRLSEVLGSADMLVVLLEKSAGAFSVPSKTLSYLCAGRPVIGLMPEENLASELLTQAECGVFNPDVESIDDAAKWVAEILSDDVRQARVGAAARDLAEARFSLVGCADRFDQILQGATTDSSTGPGRV